MKQERKFLFSLLIITILILQSATSSPAGSGTSNPITVLAATEAKADKTITLYANGTKNKSKKLQISSSTLTIDRLYFISSDSSIAKVDRESGKVTAVKKGTATITAYVTAGGKNKIFTVLVNVKNPFVKITKSTKTIKKGKTYQFKAKAYGLKEKIKWKVSNSKIASINKSTGKLKAKKAGKVTVTAKCGKKSAKKTIKIK